MRIDADPLAQTRRDSRPGRGCARRSSPGAWTAGAPSRCPRRRGLKARRAAARGASGRSRCPTTEIICQLASTISMHSSKYAAQKGSTPAALARSASACPPPNRRRGCRSGRNARSRRRNPRRAPGTALPGSTAAPGRSPATPAPPRSGPGSCRHSVSRRRCMVLAKVEIGGVPPDELHLGGALAGVAEAGETRGVDHERHRRESPGQWRVRRGRPGRRSRV